MEKGKIFIPYTTPPPTQSIKDVSQSKESCLIVEIEIWESWIKDVRKIQGWGSVGSPSPFCLSNKTIHFLPTFGASRSGEFLFNQRLILFTIQITPFPEHRLPLGTQWGLRAGIPTGGKGFQGFPMTRPAGYGTFEAWIGSIVPLFGFCPCCSPFPSEQPAHQPCNAAA